MVRAKVNWQDQGGRTGHWRDPMERAQKFGSRFGAEKLFVPCLCAAQDGCRMGLLATTRPGRCAQPAALAASTTIERYLLSIKDSP